MQRHGFILKSIIVKNIDQTFGKRGQQNLWRYRALAGGFSVFRHEYIFLLRKADRSRTHALRCSPAR